MGKHPPCQREKRTQASHHSGTVSTEWGIGHLSYSESNLGRPMAAPLFSPLDLDGLSLPHRVAMAPLTRNRAGEGNVPGDLNADYYRQRASAALIVSEATQVAPKGQGYPRTPGIHSEEQVEGWADVTDAVHAA